MHVVYRSRTLIKLFAAAGLVAVLIATMLNGRQQVSASAEGPSASHTNAPGEGNCTACHTEFPLNSGVGSVAISGVPRTYLPGQQIPVTVTTSEPFGNAWGFQMTAIDSRGRAAGTLTPPTEMPQRTQVIAGIVGGNERKYIEHTISGLFTPGMGGANQWTFTWTAPETRVGKIGFYAAGNGANSDLTTSGDYIYTTAAATLAGSAISNFDGDLNSDIAVFRPSTGAWYSYSSSTGEYSSYQFGLTGDVIAPGDYDGDGTTDLAVFRPSTGTWYLGQSTLGFAAVQFGAEGDEPVAGDYDGDGRTDIGVFRPSDGFWYLLQSTAGLSITNFGLDGDKVAPGDYDADAVTDIAVYRPSTGVWYVMQSSTGFTATQFGSLEDAPVQSDYDGDGKTDIAVFRPSAGAWYINRSTDGLAGVTFGVTADIPTPADYDGDGKSDIAVYRPSDGTWYISRSSDDTFFANVFGLAGDVPVPAAYLAQ